MRRTEEKTSLTTRCCSTTTPLMHVPGCPYRACSRHRLFPSSMANTRILVLPVCEAS